MVTEIDPILDLIAGDSLRLRFTVEEDGTGKDIEGATFKWRLFDKQYEEAKADAVLDEDDSSVTFHTTSVGRDPTIGEFQVNVDEGATDSLRGEYWQRVIVDPSDDTKKTWRGRVLLEQ